MGDLARWTKHKLGCASLMRPWSLRCDCGLWDHQDLRKPGDAEKLAEEVKTWPEVEEHETDDPDYPL